MKRLRSVNWFDLRTRNKKLNNQDDTIPKLETKITEFEENKEVEIQNLKGAKMSCKLFVL